MAVGQHMTILNRNLSSSFFGHVDARAVGTGCRTTILDSLQQPVVLSFSPCLPSNTRVQRKPWWAIDTAAWREAFAPFYKFASISEHRDTPLSPWSEADVQEFIKSDPVHGPRLSRVRQGATIASVGAVVGGLATAGLAFRYSKSAVGAAGAFLGGATMS